MAAFCIHESYVMIDRKYCISVPCSTGHYKFGAMKACQTCAAGKEPDSNKAACGKLKSYFKKVKSKNILMCTKS